MQVWTFLHITFMFASITVSYGLVTFSLVAAYRMDVPALRAHNRIAARTGRIEAILPVLGIAFGLAAAIAGGWDLLEGWLVLAYLLIGGSIALTILSNPDLKRMKAALDANDGDEAGADLATILRGPRLYVWNLAYLVILVALIWDMVYKPAF